MQAEQIFTNARVVTATDLFVGTVAVRDGVIHDVSEGRSQLPQAEDLNGDYLMPGLIELHTDNLEKYMNPRPGVDWPSESAVLAHDAQVISAGITTVFDALAIGDVNPKGDRLKQLPVMLDAITHAQSQGHTRAEHRLHLRCELSHAKTLDMFHELVGNPLVQLVSVMDHSPGQRQFVKLEKYREYYQGKYHLNDADMDAFIALQLDNSRQYSDRYRRAIVDECRERSLSVASHDDATLDHARESAEYGMCIAEFPTTVEAAEASHSMGLKVLMGAPNIVRGGSHSGNVAAADLASQGVLDILSSDYYPASLLQAACMLADQDNAYGLPAAVATISMAPAQAAGLLDRGEIRAGLNADLLRVRKHKKQFVVQRVWRNGNRVF
ncbi:phosphonate metabolism protein PhnM [Pollutimonas subterranea]|uniref:Phosphonate metabolism protein PhnM n=1 Tax=Pollutimonas subterranea TaxID=2045210 RepID=A0A2N4U357_9BURK|nr:alpha-D-ribose 1-methylphosphonate 5-triphosphate diphosphatase [Pollutimonas subterranea]PLC49460.1 phosphonate metabolism protein PhnM [Pollutimonas subterranea]